MPSWADRHADLAALASRQLFFVGGAPRSGTTWLQQLLDAHPDVICQGEGLYLHHMAGPLEKLMAERRKVLEEKNTNLFRHTGGYPLPDPADTDILAGTAILLGFAQQAAGRPFRAIGEKTPENVFFFPRLQRLFPAARFIAIARDPRDVLASSWHFFHRDDPTKDDPAACLAFIRSALPSMSSGARAMLEFKGRHPAETVLFTYEGLLSAPVPIATVLFRLLGVSDDQALVADCVARTSFAAVAGRPAGVEQRGAFLRKGVAGDWRTAITDEMNDVILKDLGWMFPHFGWTP